MARIEHGRHEKKRLMIMVAKVSPNTEYAL